MPPALLPLDMIGIEFGTDKSSISHNYLVFYERFFEKLRLEPLKILEVGVFQGASLKMWEKYFPNARIIGADIDPTAVQYATERVGIEIIDQSNVQNLVDLGVKHGPFDIIIEDGSHYWDHQITTLQILFPFVKDRGYYVAEDLQTNFGSYVEKYQNIASISCVEYLKKLVDLRVGDEYADIEDVEDPFLRSFGRSIGFLAFARHVCLIEKRLERRRQVRDFIGAPLMETSGGDGLGLLVHVGYIGDVENPDAPYVNIHEDYPHGIQGFRFFGPEYLTAGLEYRARLPDGAWTDWVAGDGFAGSRGRGDHLTGFAVRLTGAFRRTHRLTVAGAFADEPGIVVVEDGQDCVPDPGIRLLRGLQILLEEKG